MCMSQLQTVWGGNLGRKSTTIFGTLGCLLLTNLKAQLHEARVQIQ